VIRRSRISVRSALDNHGVDQKNMSSNSWIIKLSQLDFFSETFRLSIRNVFRQRSRLVMTLGLLAAGGAMFMTAMNVSEAWDKNLKRIYQQRLYDLEVRLNKSMDANSALEKIKSIELNFALISCPLNYPGADCLRRQLCMRDSRRRRASRRRNVSRGSQRRDCDRR